MLTDFRVLGLITSPLYDAELCVLWWCKKLKLDDLFVSQYSCYKPHSSTHPGYFKWWFDQTTERVVSWFWNKKKAAKHGIQQSASLSAAVPRREEGGFTCLCRICPRLWLIMQEHEKTSFCSASAWTEEMSKREDHRFVELLWNRRIQLYLSLLLVCCMRFKGETQRASLVTSF